MQHLNLDKNRRTARQWICALTRLACVPTPLPPDSARRDFMAVGLAIVLLLLLGFMVAIAPGPW